MGNSLGHYLETDKRMWLTEQARFLRVRVDIPLNKPLCRGGNILNLDGEKTWVNFKYERLPSFCYVCGYLGHDGKHCQNQPYNPDSPKQYGEWLRATAARKAVRIGKNLQIAGALKMNNQAVQVEDWLRQ